MKDVKNYEGIYAVTEDGKVWSYKSKKFLKPSVSRCYLKVVLCKDGDRKNFNIHRLVAEAYVPNPDNLPCVNHKDECKTNNNAQNLAWCTVADNSTYGTSRARCSAKLSKAIYCVELEKTFKSARDAAATLGFKRANIWCALSGRTELAYGYHWRYV